MAAAMMAALLVLVVLLMVAGLAGSVLPFLPGTPLIFLGAFIYAFATGFEVIGPWRLAALAVLVVLTYALDYAAGALGARKLGGSRWAALGALVGGVVGMFFGLVGILVGPVAGAIAFELVYRRQVSAGLKSGAGAVFGMVVGGAAKFSLAVVMVGLFAFWALRG
jgi:uncharacterized protein YqgC (DUF456 family)